MSNPKSSVIKDRKFCMAGMHSVPAGQMTTFQTGKITMHLCESCRNKKIEARNNEKAKRE